MKRADIRYGSVTETAPRTRPRHTSFLRATRGFVYVCDSARAR